MSNIFNSNFEIALRILIILNQNKNKAFSKERLISYDFITLYAKNFKIYYENINGDNMFYISEYSSIKHKYDDSIKFLLFKGLIILTDNATKYQISPVGTEYIESLITEYAKTYKHILSFVEKKYANTNDQDLTKEITNKSIAEANN